MQRFCISVANNWELKHLGSFGPKVVKGSYPVFTKMPKSCMRGDIFYKGIALDLSPLPLAFGTWYAWELQKSIR